MDNQQAKMWDTELAWLAGFIDGEGSLCMMRTNVGRYKTNGEPVGGFVPRITVSNTDFKTLGYVSGIIERFGLPYHVYTREPTGNPKHRRSWHLSVQGIKRVARWLYVLEPHLRTKHYQALLLLEYAETRLKTARNSPLTIRQTEILEIFRNPQSPQRLNALKWPNARSKRFDTEWYSPAPNES